MILFAGLLFTILYTAFVGLIGGELAWYIDAASFFFVLVPLIFFLFITKNGKSIYGYIKSSFRKDYVFSEGELEIIARAAGNAMRIILAAGGFSSLIGLVITLRRLDDPQILGPYLSVMITSLLYSIGLAYFVFFPLKVWAEKKMKASE